ncbi:zinc-ribbon domain-containing protein [Micromonospora sp. CPCC 206060]|uniref:zinc ribbon domain-containing protein n=1 Tax=Micromonospora sp. CPCC 206060 TaxID=3122406 RepID=UPI002FEFE629
MITCPECATHNRDDERFCGACGVFLRWDNDVTTATGSGPAPVTDDRTGGGQADPDRTGDDRTTTERAGDDRTTTERTGDERTGDDSAGKERAREERPGPPEQPPPRQPGPSERTTESPGPAPVPVDPVDPVDREAHPTPEQQFCPACGRDNRPDRRFCRYCGDPLDTVVRSTPERTWWQRLWDRLRRRTRRRPARDDRRSTAARLTLLIVFALCLVAVLAVVGPPLVRRAVEAVRDRTQDPMPLVPDTVSASSALPDAAAARLTDGANNRYWAPTGTGINAWVEGRYREPVRLLTVVITPGVGLNRQKFLASGRPRRLTVITERRDGRQERTDIDLRDTPGEQHFTVEEADVVRIRLEVRSTYGHDLVPAVAIAEAEFFGRR